MKCCYCKKEINEDGSAVKYYKCKKCQREKAKEAYNKNPGKFRKRKKEFKHNNPEKQKEYDKKSRRKLKMDALNAYGSLKCMCCGETELDFLCLDHIDNDGAEHRKLTGRGNSFYFYLRKHLYPKLRLQVLCYNCNNSKKISGHCIHNQ